MTPPSILITIEFAFQQHLSKHWEIIHTYFLKFYLSTTKHESLWGTSSSLPSLPGGGLPQGRQDSATAVPTGHGINPRCRCHRNET